MENSSHTPYVPAFDDIMANMRIILQRLQEEIPAGQLSIEQIKMLVEGLPRIEEKRLIELGEKESSCPICFTPYLAIVAEEEMALAMDSPAHPIENLGVTKLSKSWQCGHMFCRRDISKWISDGHESCPLCRRLLIEGREQPEPTAEENAASEVREREYLRASASFEAQIREIREQMLRDGHAVPEDLFDNVDADPPPPWNNERNEEDDRREYSSMYS